MLRINVFTEEERKIVSRFSARNEKDLRRLICAMLPYLPQEELSAALSAVAKLNAAVGKKREEKQSVSRIRFLERITTLRAGLGMYGRAFSGSMLGFC